MNNLIKCPYCNYQYLPGEIFDPKSFLGQPKNIVRNNLGEILGFEGISSDLKESYNCDCCKKDFEVIAKITFNTPLNKNEDENTSIECEIKRTGLFD